MSLTPFVRYEEFDTQADVPGGFSSSSVNSQDIVTFGLDFQPLPQIVFKLDYEDWEESADSWNAVVGYVF